VPMPHPRTPDLLARADFVETVQRLRRLLMAQ
jgi:hypothetical protein